VHEVTIRKLIDLVSPSLCLASATGRHSTLTLVLNRPGAPAGTPFMTYRLTDAAVASDTHSGSGGDRSVEVLTLNYVRIDQTYTAADGSVVETTFDSSGL
jgi:type VI protein secretion system component Hcp